MRCAASCDEAMARGDLLRAATVRRDRDAHAERSNGPPLADFLRRAAAAKAALAGGATTVAAGDVAAAFGAAAIAREADGGGGGGGAEARGGLDVYGK